MVQREKKSGTSRKRDTKGKRTVKRTTKRGLLGLSEKSLKEQSRKFDEAAMRSALPFGIHSDRLMPNIVWVDQSPAERKPMPDRDWSKGQVAVAEAALAGHLRLSIPCTVYEAVQQTAALTRVLRSPFGAGYNALLRALVIFNIKDPGDEDETPTAN